MKPSRMTDPVNAVIHARSLLQNNQPEDAVKQLQRAGKPIEKVAPAQHLLARAYMLLGRSADAARCAKRAVQLDGQNSEYRFDLARALSLGGDFSGAAEALEPIPPGDSYSKARRMMGKALMDAGRYEDAASAIRPALDDESCKDDVRLTLSLARLALSPGMEDKRAEAIARLEPFADRESEPERVRADAHQHLARLHDALGEYGEAFGHADRFNELVREHWDADEFTGRVKAMLDVWTPDAWAGAGRAPEKQGNRHIFVLGMPRSGTTLIEQMFGAHPDVFAAGERPEINQLCAVLQPPVADEKLLLNEPERFEAGAMSKAGRAYVEAMRKARKAGGAPRAKWVVDKMPYNFLYTPFIRAALPSCTIFRTVRDPLDVGLSNYMHLFTGDHRFSTRLDWLGRFIVEEERIMAHFASLPGMDIYEVRYEELVQDPEGASKRMYEIAGLEWTPEVLGFHKQDSVAATASIDQVRRPVHTSRVGRHERYAEWLAPLAEAYERGRGL